MKRFPVASFRRFCAALTLQSKELGQCQFRWNGAQKRLIAEIDAGLREDVHRFVVLKARQLGITTVALALDLFWLATHPGTQGALAVSSESVRDLCRSTLDAYRTSFPEGARFPLTVNNRSEIRLGNGSRLVHLIAGGRASGALARGQGLSYLHATEMSSWQDQEGVLSLDASLAEANPNRLYLFESTARGYNLFEKMWHNALESKSTRAVFIGWWARADYVVPRTGRLWGTYGRDKPNREEARMAKEVERRFAHVITPEQWAWWRWRSAEAGGDKLLLAEFPFTPEQAFVMTGDGFFSPELQRALVERTRNTRRSEWIYTIGDRFEDTLLEESEDGPLSIWEEPDPSADYIIAADPAYGRSDWGDSFCVEVYKATATHLTQVAEFNSPDCTAYGFAWILAHLAGAYGTLLHPPTVILELSGPGRLVLAEMQRMPAQYAGAIAGLADGTRATLADLFGSIQHFLYHRPDSLSGSRLLHWETSARTKSVMMNTLRDGLAKGDILVSSPELAEEATFITQIGTRIEAEGRTRKDDRIVASALAAVCWEQQVRPVLWERTIGAQAAADPVQRSVAGWLQQVRESSRAVTWRDAGSETWRD